MWVGTVLLGLALGACGTGGTVAPAGADEPAETPAPLTLEDLGATAETSPPATITPCGAAAEPGGWVGYTAPQALPWRESLARFPYAAISKARELNRAGLAARAAEDASAARGAYEEALRHSPRFAPARYNLACELAREPSRASHDRAIGELETLLTIGSQDARAFVARARFDVDFACLRDDARFAAMQAAFRFDPGDITGRQLCEDPARLADLIDPVQGIAVDVYVPSARDSRFNRTVSGQLTGKAAFDLAIEFVGELYFERCDEPVAEGSFVTATLARVKGDSHTLEADTPTCWGLHHEAHFERTASGWRLTALSMRPR